MLARREHSRKELARKLSPRAESPEALNALLDSLESKKQLSDERFASERAHILSRKYGAARIRHDLRSKGIADDVLALALKSSGEDELERGKKVLQKKFPIPAENLNEHAKRMRFLQSRGFSSEIIHELLSAGEAG